MPIRPTSRVHLVADDGHDRAALVTAVVDKTVDPPVVDLVVFDSDDLDFAHDVEHNDDRTTPGTYHWHEDME